MATSGQEYLKKHIVKLSTRTKDGQEKKFEDIRKEWKLNEIWIEEEGSHCLCGHVSISDVFSSSS